MLHVLKAYASFKTRMLNATNSSTSKNDGDKEEDEDGKKMVEVVKGSKSGCGSKMCVML